MATKDKQETEEAMTPLVAEIQEMLADIGSDDEPIIIDHYERLCFKSADLLRRCAEALTNNGCVSCGEKNDGGYGTEDVGWFCSQCWQALREHFTVEAAEDAKAALTQKDSGWQPIETAPKDGTRVLLLSDHGHVVDGSWNPGGAMHMPHWMGGIVFPTHWMPLSAIPASPGEEQK